MRISDRDFFNQKAKDLAPQLLGKLLCRNIDGEIIKAKIVEVEAYTGTSDTASHVSKGKTDRTRVIWEKGGSVYVYLCYGIHFLINIVCAKDEPQTVLIRGVENAVGPGRVTKYLKIDKSLWGEDVITSKKIWVEDGEKVKDYKTSKRIGIDYASPKDREALLRFYI